MRISLPIAIAILIANTLSAEDKGAPGRSVAFFAEEITLAVTDSTAEVTGIYHFRNGTERAGDFPVMFPFHVDSLSDYPDRIAGFLIESDTVGPALEIRRLEGRGGVAIGIPLKPLAETAWRLEYSQRIRGRSARYILTSTQSWGEPLEAATYEFIVPVDFTGVEVWPEADSVIIDADHCRYIAHRTDFMPIKDMEIMWAPKNQAGSR